MKNIPDLDIQIYHINLFIIYLIQKLKDLDFETVVVTYNEFLNKFRYSPYANILCNVCNWDASPIAQKMSL